MAAGDGRKLSFSERDRLRREGKSGERPREGLPSKEATAQYLRKIDQLFSEPKTEAAKLAEAVRAAHGSPKFAEACRAYFDQAGAPTDPALISMFLDSRDSEIIVRALEALGVVVASGSIELSRGLQSQLRTLAHGADDAVAALAEELIQGE